MKPGVVKNNALVLLVGLCIKMQTCLSFTLNNPVSYDKNMISSMMPFHPNDSRRQQSSLALMRGKNTCAWFPNAGPTALTLKVASTESTEADNIDDLGSIQSLFTKFCDSDGLMTKKKLAKVPYLADMLNDGDLLSEELDDIWNAAPKFPDMKAKDVERIDVDSFVQIYRDIDDLFEDDDEDDEEPSSPKGASTSESASKGQESSTTVTSTSATTKSPSGVEEDEALLNEELESIYKSLSDKDGLLSKSELRQWEEVSKLIVDGLLGEEEFDDLWQKTTKSNSDDDQIDLKGFLSFNTVLDDLFEFDDEEFEDDDDDDEDDEESAPVPADSKDRAVVEGDDLDPTTLFYALADEDLLVGKEELKLWGELNAMLDDGDVLPDELSGFFDSIKKSPTNSNKLDEAGFKELCKRIDDLFEDDDESAEKEVYITVEDEVEEEVPTAAAVQANPSKANLLELVEYLNTDEERLPCGLEGTETEDKQVSEYVTELETDIESNLVQKMQGQIDMSQLAGTWDLLYTTSSAMKFNQGLSGLGGSVPNGKFGGLRQILQSSKFMSDVEYVEHIAVKPEQASFDVKINGNWGLTTSVSLFTGQPSLVLSVVPDRVTYGPTSTRADHWKSLGPTNMLDVTYLDDDIRIMRGNTATDAIFVFQKTAE